VLLDTANTNVSIDDATISDDSELKLDYSKVSFGSGAHLRAHTQSRVTVNKGSSVTANAGVLLNGAQLNSDIVQDAIKVDGKSSVKIVALNAANVSRNVRTLLWDQNFAQGAKLYGEGNVEVSSGAHEVKEGFDTLKLFKLTSDGAGTSVSFKTDATDVTVKEGAASNGALIAVTRAAM